MMPVGPEEYENVVEHLAETNPTAVLNDPAHVASSVIAGIDRSVSPADGYVRTHGTDEFLSVTLYPSDVIAASKQSQDRVGREFHRIHGRSIHDESLEVYAIYTMLLDLEDALDVEVLPGADAQGGD